MARVNVLSASRGVCPLAGASINKTAPSRRPPGPRTGHTPPHRGAMEQPSKLLLLRLHRTSYHQLLLPGLYKLYIEESWPVWPSKGSRVVTLSRELAAAAEARDLARLGLLELRNHPQTRSLVPSGPGDFAGGPWAVISQRFHDGDLKNWRWYYIFFPFLFSHFFPFRKFIKNMQLKKQRKPRGH